MNSAFVRKSFARLGIEVTTDVRAIKTAYTSLAKTIDRETEQLKFDELHSAYRMALEYAKQREKAQLEKEFLEDLGSPVEFAGNENNSSNLSSSTTTPVESPKNEFDFSSIKDDAKTKETPVESPKKEFDFSSIKDDAKPKETPVESPKNEFDFSSIKDDVKTKETPVESPKNEFDFSSVVDDDIPTGVAEIVDKINAYREKNGLNSEAVIKLLSQKKIMRFAYDMTYLYDMLARESNDPLVWNSFKTELIIEKAAENYDFRQFLCEFKPVDTKAFQILNTFCDKLEEQLKKNREIAEKEIFAISQAHEKTVKYKQMIGFGAGGMLLSVFIMLLGGVVSEAFKVAGNIILVVGIIAFVGGVVAIFVAAGGIEKLGDKWNS